MDSNRAIAPFFYSNSLDFQTAFNQLKLYGTSGNERVKILSKNNPPMAIPVPQSKHHGIWSWKARWYKPLNERVGIVASFTFEFLKVNLGHFTYEQVADLGNLELLFTKGHVDSDRISQFKLAVQNRDLVNIGVSPSSFLTPSDYQRKKNLKREVEKKNHQITQVESTIKKAQNESKKRLDAIEKQYDQMQKEHFDKLLRNYEQHAKKVEDDFREQHNELSNANDQLKKESEQEIKQLKESFVYQLDRLDENLKWMSTVFRTTKGQVEPFDDVLILCSENTFITEKYNILCLLFQYFRSAENYKKELELDGEIKKYRQTHPHLIYHFNFDNYSKECLNTMIGLASKAINLSDIQDPNILCEMCLLAHQIGALDIHNTCTKYILDTWSYVDLNEILTIENVNFEHPFIETIVKHLLTSNDLFALYALYVRSIEMKADSVKNFCLEKISETFSSYSHHFYFDILKNTLLASEDPMITCICQQVAAFFYAKPAFRRNEEFQDFLGIPPLYMLKILQAAVKTKKIFKIKKINKNALKAMQIWYIHYKDFKELKLKQEQFHSCFFILDPTHRYIPDLTPKEEPREIFNDDASR